MNHSLFEEFGGSRLEKRETVSAVRGESSGEILRGNVFKSFQCESFLNETRRLHGIDSMLLSGSQRRSEAIHWRPLERHRKRRKQTEREEEWETEKELTGSKVHDSSSAIHANSRASGFSESGDSPEIRHESEFSINQLLIGVHIVDFTSIPLTSWHSLRASGGSHLNVCDLYHETCMQTCLNHLTCCGFHSVNSIYRVDFTGSPKK